MIKSPLKATVTVMASTMLFLFITFNKTAFSGTKPRVALLPFENMSREYCDIDGIMTTIYQKSEAFVESPSQDETDKVLLDLRLRHTGFLTTKEAMEIGRKLGVEGILTGIISQYKESPEPRIGLIVKLISTKRLAPLVWMETYQAAGSDKETWLGLGKVFDKNDFLNEFIENLIKKIPFQRLDINE